MEIILRDHVEHVGSAAKSSRSPTAMPATTCCRGSWRCRRPRRNKKRVERERKIVEAREAEERGAAEAIGDRAGRPRHHDRPQGRRQRPAVRLGHQRRHRRPAEGEGLRDRSPQDPAAGAAQDARRDDRCRSSCIATSPCSSRSPSSRTRKHRTAGRRNPGAGPSATLVRRPMILGGRCSLLSIPHRAARKIARWPSPSPRTRARFRTISKPSAPCSARS